MSEEKPTPRFSQAKIVKYFRINRKILPKVNRAIKKYNGLQEGIPIDKIGRKMKEFGLYLVSEDGTQYAGIFTGRSGRGRIDIAGYNKKRGQWEITTNMELQILWEKKGQQYNITSFIS